MKNVKLINFTAENFGIFKAIELDFDKFKSGVLSVKGQVGEGKSTLLNAVQTSTSGAKKLADSEQYGDSWSTETCILDGERKLFIKATKADGKAPKFQLYELDKNGKKVISPVVDGEKATHAAYLKSLNTPLTFGIKDFLSENNTVQTKFMFSLYADKLKDLGVDVLISELEQLTLTRDKLRTECTHMGAFMADFERDGYKKERLEDIKTSDIEAMQTELQALLTEKATLEGSAQTILERKRSAIQQKGNDVLNEIRDLSNNIKDKHNSVVTEINAKRQKAIDAIRQAIELAKTEYSEQEKLHAGYLLDGELFTTEQQKIKEAINGLVSKKLIKGETIEAAKELVNFLDVDKEAYAKLIGEAPKKPSLPTIEGLNITEVENMPADINALIEIYKAIKPEPTKPKLPIFDGGKLKTTTATELEHEFIPLYAKRAELANEYMSVEVGATDTQEIDNKIAAQKEAITLAEARNKLAERYDLNRIWVESCARVDIQRKEINKLYAKVDTGVDGLKLTPFYDEKGVVIKTTYNGAANPEYFKNTEGKDQLLHSYSFTQRGIIAALLQSALLKTKHKAMPYIWLDDVPVDKKSRQFLAEIAEREGLNIIVSITGDFDKEKLTENEMIVEGGQIFFE